MGFTHPFSLLHVATIHNQLFQVGDFVVRVDCVDIRADEAAQQANGQGKSQLPYRPPGMVFFGLDNRIERPHLVIHHALAKRRACSLHVVAQGHDLVYQDFVYRFLKVVYELAQPFLKFGTFLAVLSGLLIQLVDGLIDLD